MYDTATDDGAQADQTGAADASQSASAPAPVQSSPADQALVTRLLEKIKGDKRYHKPAFGRMRSSMFMATNGRPKNYPAENYKAHITGQHVKAKTAALYAKNPKIVARRKESLDFVLWDETPGSLMLAYQIIQQAATDQQAYDQAYGAAYAQGAPSTTPPPGVGAFEGGPAPNAGPLPNIPPPPPKPAGFEQAFAMVQDFQQGMQKRQMLKKFGRTLELLFADAMRRQTPLDFKTGMKKLARRAVTTAAGYVEMGYQKEYGIPQATTDTLADFRQRIAHLESLKEEAAEGEIGEDDAELAELNDGMAELMKQPQILIRTGLSFDFIQSTKVIPDRRMTSLVGFVGCRHITIEYLYTKAEVKEMFGVDLGSNYTPYQTDGKRSGEFRGVDFGDSDLTGAFAPNRDENDLVCVYKMYDKPSGLVYHLCDGHKNFLKPPAAPDVTIPRFWPVYALTFNDVEDEDEAFPRSDVELLSDMQNELNRSRQGKREHRDFARPRYIYANGSIDEEKDLPNLMRVKPFEAIGINKDPTTKIAELLEAFKAPGVDPNLYDTNEIMQDATLTVGAGAAQLGGTAKATATEAAIADGTSSTIDASSIDDLDAFLTMVARDGGIILMQNVTKEEAVKVAGQGAVWIEDLGMAPEDVYDEIYLEVEAGSTGKPNQATEIRTLKEVGPLLLQVGGIPPEWLAREFLRRWDDRLDLTEAVAAGIPAIVAQNRMAQPAAGDPSKDPNQQGDKGGDKGPPAPGGPTGSGPAFGSNQTM